MTGINMLKTIATRTQVRFVAALRGSYLPWMEFGVALAFLLVLRKT
jgi:hypothetical protein